MSQDTTMGQGDEFQDDALDGLDMDPVTDPSPEEGGHIEPAPKPTAPAPAKEEGKGEGEGSGAAKKPEKPADGKQRRIEQKGKEKGQQGWQELQETVQNQQAQLDRMAIEKEQAKFEARNPIVLTPEYEARWTELCEQKLDPDHKYHKLDFSDLRKLLIDDETVAENIEAEEEFEEEEKKKPVSPPIVRTTTTKPKLPGGVDPETYATLKAAGYTDAQIADSDNISLN